jgi:hypothetical protein
MIAEEWKRKGLLKALPVLAMLLAGLTAIAFTGCAEETTGDSYYCGYVGFVKDSLIVYTKQLIESTCKAKVLGDDCDEHGRGTAIVVDNFYTRASVWRSDYETTFDVYDMVDDSTVVAFSGANSAFYRWTLKGSMEKMGTFSWKGCDMRNNVGSIRPWKDGQWRLSRANSYSDSCSFALVDVVAHEITGFFKNESDEYQQKCNDAWLLDGKTYCIGTVEKDTVISYDVRYLVGAFIRDNELKADTLWFENNYGFDYNGSPSISFRNNYILLHFNDFRLLKLDYKQTKFDLSYPVVWLDGLYWRGY